MDDFSSKGLFDTPRKSQRVRYKFKAILLGSYGAGKTSIFWRVKTGKWRPSEDEDVMERVTVTATCRTFGDNPSDYCSKTYTMESGDSVELTLWDTGGVERVRGTVTGQYCRNAHLVLLVYDVSSLESLFQLREFMTDVRIHSPKANFVLIGSKYDLPPDMPASMLDSLVEDCGIQYHFKTSALSDNAISDILYTLVSELYERDIQSGYQQPTLGSITSGINLTDNYDTEQRRCC